MSHLNKYCLKRFGLRLVLAVFALGLLRAAPSAPAATLSATFHPIAQGSNVNLTLVGKLDWVHWGLYGDTSLNRKAGATPAIADFTMVGDTQTFVGAYQYADNYNGYTWSDGTPVVAVTDTPTGVWAYGYPTPLGSGFEFDIPADVGPRILQLYVGAYKGRGTFTASLSDASAPTYSDSSLYNPANGPGAVYTITYAAASAGQTLRVRWILSDTAPGSRQEANVTLQAATLSAPDVNSPPYVAITNPPPYANFAAPADIELGARAFDTDGTVTKVEFFNGATWLGEAITSPYAIVWTNVTPGTYRVTAVASDDSGGRSTSLPQDIFVHTPGGSLGGAVALPPLTLDLTSSGMNDWVHWGLAATNLVNRKSGVPLEISELEVIGTNGLRVYEDNRTAFSWSDGTPIPDASGVTHGVFVTGLNSGFELTAPASPEPRRLQVYVGLYGARGEFRAFLSDFSAPVFVDDSFSGAQANGYAVYALDYAAASAGQHVIVQYRSKELFDPAYGNVSIQAATLVRGDPQDDTMDPVITCPPDVSVACGTTTDPNATGWATATDDGQALPTVTYTDTLEPGGCSTTAVIRRTWTAMDASGNRAECVQTVSVADTVPPVLTCPPAITIECGQSIDPSLTGQAAATDLCSGAVAVSFADAIGGGPCPAPSVISRTWTASDGCGNSVQCVQSITVLGPPGVLLLSPQMVSGEFVFSFATELGRTYTVFYSGQSNPLEWQSVNSVLGTGAMVTVTNSPPAGGAGFYRIEGQ